MHTYRFSRSDICIYKITKEHLAQNNVILLLWIFQLKPLLDSEEFL